MLHYSCILDRYYLQYLARAMATTHLVLKALAILLLPTYLLAASRKTSAVPFTVKVRILKSPSYRLHKPPLSLSLLLRSLRRC